MSCGFSSEFNNLSDTFVALVGPGYTLISRRWHSPVDGSHMITVEPRELRFYCFVMHRPRVCHAHVLVATSLTSCPSFSGKTLGRSPLWMNGGKADMSVLFATFRGYV